MVRQGPHAPLLILTRMNCADVLLIFVSSKLCCVDSQALPTCGIAGLYCLLLTPPPALLSQGAEAQRRQPLNQFSGQTLMGDSFGPLSAGHALCVKGICKSQELSCVIELTFQGAEEGKMFTGTNDCGSPTKCPRLSQTLGGCLPLSQGDVAPVGKVCARGAGREAAPFC